LRQGGGGGVRRLRSLSLFYLLQGLLRKSNVRVLLRLSCDSFMRKRFWTNRIPTGSNGFSPGAPPPGRVTIHLQRCVRAEGLLRGPTARFESKSGVVGCAKLVPPWSVRKMKTPGLPFAVQKANRRESRVDRVIAVQPIISQVYGKDERVPIRRRSRLRPEAFSRCARVLCRRSRRPCR